MKKLVVLFCGILILSVTGLAWAGQETGFYLGGSLGYSGIDVSASTIKYDDSDLGYKVFGGYNFGLIPLIDLGIEGSYIDFGNASAALDMNYNVDVTGWDLYGVGSVDLGPIGIFGKVGQIWWDSKSNIFQQVLDASGNNMAYGLGLKFKLGSVAIRAEYEYFDTDVAGIGFASAGVSWHF